MAVLTTKKRDKLKKSQFAGPDDSYPIPDASHAANAKARAKQQLDAGHMTKSTYDKIVAAANRVLSRDK
jgi:hypothetical protein